MYESAWFWILFGMLGWLLLVRPRRLRACQGHWEDESHGPAERRRRRTGGADLDGELAERDAVIAKLEERVRVLERIATDDAARLRAEIDNLR
jgi:hypothetical protein